MKYQKLTAVSDLVFTGEQSKSWKDWGEAEGAEIPVVLGNRIRGKAFRDIQRTEGASQGGSRAWLQWHPGEQEGHQGCSQLGMKSQLSPKGQQEARLRRRGNLKHRKRIVLKTSCLDFSGGIFVAFSSENTNVLSNTWAHLNNKRKN